MENSFKFSTLLWFVAGLLIPFWPISLPVCWYMAYRSYKNGRPVGATMSDLHSAMELHKNGVLSDAELNEVKKKTLGAR